MSFRVKLDRREFFKVISIVTASLLTPFSLKAATKVPHIVVLGGGFAGSTCAKYLKLWGGNSINVTLIDKNDSYVSPILSNLILNNRKTLNSLTFSYDNLNIKYSINTIFKDLNDIDDISKVLSFDDGSTLGYDKLILAPGIDFIKTNNYSFDKVPHAWIAGSQTNILKSQIETMQNGDDFILTIPKSPYRCPPGPYERACVVADYLKNIKGFYDSKVIVLDENSDIIVEKDIFNNAFINYGIDYRANCNINNVNDTTNTLSFTQNNKEYTLSSKVLNVIPKQKAASIIFQAGLNKGNWAIIDPISYESQLKKDIYIIGDSQGTSQPKAGHIGNSEAKVCADAVLRSLNNLNSYPNPKTNSACYSPVSTKEATWLTAVYKYDANTKQMVLANTQVYPAAASLATNKNYINMFNWAENLFSDTFS